MNVIAFDTYVRRDSYRNGFENCEVIDEYKYRISSTAHSGVAEVMWNEKFGFIIDFFHGPEEIIVGDLANLAGAIRDILNKSLAYDKRVKEQIEKYGYFG